MGKRPRYFSPSDRERLLAAIGECRKALRQAEDHLRPCGPEYNACGKVAEAIDELAGALTGDREYFHLKIAPARTLGGRSKDEPSNLS